MVEVIQADNHLYRTVEPEATVDLMKQIQANEWNAKV